MPVQHPHEEQAIQISCMDGRPSMTDAINAQYAQLRAQHGQVFRLTWGGGPMLFLDERGGAFAAQHYLLAQTVHPFNNVYGTIHMSCGAYGALLGRTYSSREEEIESKWNDIDEITRIILKLTPHVSVDIKLLDVDGTFLERSPITVDPLSSGR